jgi:hypothetical protein
MLFTICLCLSGASLALATLALGAPLNRGQHVAR